MKLWELNRDIYVHNKAALDDYLKTNREEENEVEKQKKIFAEKVWKNYVFT